MHKNHVYRHEIREHSKTVRKGHLHVYTKSGNKRRAIHNDHLYISVYGIQKQNKTMYADHIYIFIQNLDHIHNRANISIMHQ